MTEHDDTEYEERLRRVLREVPSPHADADAVLSRVETGARRRVRRRRIGGAVVGVAAVATAAFVVVPTFDQDSNVADGPASVKSRHKQPLHSTELHKKGSAAIESPRRKGKATAERATLAAGSATKATDLAVSDIALSDQGDLSLIGQGSCSDGPCLVTGAPESASNFRVAPTTERLLKPVTVRATASTATRPGIQVGDDESNSWTWTDAFYASHDAGETWQAVRLPGSMSVNDVQAAGGRVWAFGSRPDGRAVVASSEEHKDDWVTAAAPVRADETITTPMAVDDEVAFVATNGTDKSAFVRHDGSRWVRSPAPCARPVESSTADGTVWLGCRRANGLGTVSWSTDGGTSWKSSRLEVSPQLTALGGIDSRTAMISSGKMLYVFDTSGVTAAATVPFSGDKVWGDKVGYTSIRFDSDGTGYATTTGGALARSDDAGATWRVESLP